MDNNGKTFLLASKKKNISQIDLVIKDKSNSCWHLKIIIKIYYSMEGIYHLTNGIYLARFSPAFYFSYLILRTDL